MKRLPLYISLAAVWWGLTGCSTLGTMVKIGGQAAGYQELVDMGGSMEKAGREFTEEEKYYIGRTVAVTLLAEDPLVRQEQLTDYVNAVGSTLVLASSRPEIFHGYHFGVLIGENKVNAFACPGGFLFVTCGLLRLCRTEDELAAVLAHEVAHIILEHPMQAIQASHEREAFASLAKFGIRKAGESYSEVAQLSNVFDGVVKDVVQAVAHGYSRDKEAEADKLAVDILARTGYAPSALAAVLSRMDAHSCYHGDPKVRAAAAQTAARAAASAADVFPARTRRFQQMAEKK